MLGVHQLQVAHREAVEPHVLVLLQAAEAGNVLDVVVLGFGEVVQNAAGRNHALPQVIHAKALERGGAEVARERVVGVVGPKDPFIQRVGAIVGAEGLLKLAPALLAEQDFGRREILEQFTQVIERALGGQKLAGADIKKGNAGLGFTEVNGAEVVIRAALQHVVVHAHAGRDELRDAALHQALGFLGVFELVADGHALAGAHQLGQVGIERMVREAGQGHFAAAARAPLRQRDVENAAGRDGIFAEGLVKITHPKQQHRARMLLLELVVLLHQRRLSHGRDGHGEVVGADGFDDEFFFGCRQNRAVSFSLPDNQPAAINSISQKRPAWATRSVAG